MYYVYMKGESRKREESIILVDEILEGAVVLEESGLEISENPCCCC